MAEELKEQVEKTQDKPEKKRRPRKERGEEGRAEKVADEFVDRVVHVNRVSKTVKGGKRFAFAALVVVGDQKGRIGFAHAKAKEVPDAIKKATDRARRHLIRVPMREGRTLHHDAYGHFGAGRVTIRTAPAGTGIIAGGPMRAVFEAMGIQDVVAKCTGSSNPHNMVRATFDALMNSDSPRSVASKRGKKVGDIVSRRDGETAAKEIAE
jgi:small subunit ribosomal protein S5